ncbi:TPA: helix-turn-helix domain-containing protein [Kluyvera ascorbata]|nr:helix-turn-helix domain-containing protein [Kluyvera ascorbata]
MRSQLLINRELFSSQGIDGSFYISVLNEEPKFTVIVRIHAGISISAIAREFNTIRQTILRGKAGQQ